MNIVVVEKEKLLRNKVEILFSGERTTDQVNTFTSAEDAMEKADWKNMQILITGIGLPRMNGIKLIEWVRTKHPHISCMVLSRFDDRETVFDALSAGASGYLLHDTSPRELIEALHELYNGGAPMSPKIARMVVSKLHQPTTTDNPLTKREQSVLISLEKGNSYKEAALELGISPNTIHTHVKNINEKLQTDNSDAAILHSRRLGWI